MCGLAAIFSKHALSPQAPDLIHSMTRAMAHRGPDAEGYYIGERVALGHRRLSIIDLSVGANQPMWDISDRYAIVFNGEIYNFRELRAQLGDYPFRTHSDTEVILAGYCTWGLGVLKKLNGIFAFVIYDKTTGEALLARDRFGIKPLYYTLQDDVLAAASEQRALLQIPKLPRTLHRGALADYLLNSAIMGDQRLIEAVQQLPAGHYARWSPSAPFVVQPYFRLCETPFADIPADPALVHKELRNLLGQAVSRQMMSDVPLGAFLSGGIDSSALVALMKEAGVAKPLTFTIGFAEKQFDESGYAGIVARKYNTNHTVLTLRPNDFLEALPEALDAMDTPTSDGVNTYVVSKITRRAGVTVALSGLGGDELFAGYESFKRFADWQHHFWWRLPGVLRRAAASPLKFSGSPRIKRIAHLLGIPQYAIHTVYPIFRGVYDPGQVTQLLADRQQVVNPVADALLADRSYIQQFAPLSQYSLAELSGYTREMLLKDTDQMSMASGLEVRVPFLDNDLVSYVLNISDQMKHPHTSKQLLVQSLGKLLPPEIVNRPKMGFSLPWDTWLRHELKDFCAIRLQALAARGILQADQINRLWRWFLNKQHNVLWSHVWMLVVLEHWLQRNIDQ